LSVSFYNQKHWSAFDGFYAGKAEAITAAFRNTEGETSRIGGFGSWQKDAGGILAEHASSQVPRCRASISGIYGIGNSQYG
jgi:hypothetical protein